jgi:vesicle transport through interaction with t-SNAREs protein 1
MVIGTSQASQLEVEIQGIPQSIKTPYLTRLRQANSDLSKYKALSKDLHARVNLPGRPKSGVSLRFDDPYADERTERERLLTGTETLSEGTQRLGNAQRIGLETEDMGIEILRNLRGQRETLENTRDTVSLWCPCVSVVACS